MYRKEYGQKYMCEISIIIPIYNKEDNLVDCLNSILGQTYENFEAICIDDCSKDNSRIILEEYAKRDRRLKIIYNSENEGAAAARNKGIKEALGEYLLILDADDIFDKDLILITYKLCKEKNLDILVYDYTKMDNTTKRKRIFSMPLSMERKLRNRIFSREDIKNFSFQMCLAAPWVKMYRREFIIETGIRFQNLSSSNDGFFGRTILLLEGNFFYLSKSLVTYRINGKNQISTLNNNSIFNFIRAVKEIKKVLEEKNIYEKNERSFCSYVLTVTIGYLLGMDRDFVSEINYDIVMELNIILGENAVFQNNYQGYIFHDLKNQKDIKRYLLRLNEYDYLFRYENEKVLYLKRYLNESKKKIALWGYGYSGREFFEKGRKTGILIDLIVDENYVNFHDDFIKSPESLKKNDYIVLITAATYGKNILERAIKINDKIVLIDLQCYFTFGFDLRDCIFDKQY